LWRAWRRYEGKQWLAGAYLLAVFDQEGVNGAGGGGVDEVTTHLDLPPALNIEQLVGEKVEKVGGNGDE